MLQDCFTCPRKVVQHKKHLLNGQNQEMELFCGTKILPNLEVFSGIEGVQTFEVQSQWSLKQPPPKMYIQSLTKIIGHHINHSYKLKN